jgi:hypothetical protein
MASRLRNSTLVRALRAADAELTKDEAASTLFRFFRSQHVKDLRTILTGATLLLFIFALAIACLAFLEALTAPPPSTRLLVGSKFFLTYIGPAITIYSAVWAWAYLSASARLGIVDLFASEISTLCRVGTIVDVGRRIVKLSTMDEPPKGSTFVSKEDYFPIFDKNSKELQVLESSIVINITKFYTYMKATRDSLRRLDQLNPRQGAESSPKTSDAETADTWKAVVSDVIYMLFLGYESGRNAIKDLIEYQPTATENKMVILITELECYSYLREYFEDQPHRVRLRKREQNYKPDVG